MKINSNEPKFKVGDKVLFTSGGIGGYQSIVAVDRITKSGLVEVNHILFHPSGMQRGGSAWHHSYIEPLTDESEKAFREKATHQKLYKFLRDVAWEKYPVGVLQKVYRVLVPE
jgi:hypothetical protein